LGFNPEEPPMGMFDGKKGLVFGIANDHSIAWAITQKLHAEGAEMGFTHLPDKDPERPRMERRLRKLVEPLGAELILPCDVQRDEDLDRIFTATREKFGNVDFVLHSIAYAPIEDLQGPTYNVSRDGFKLAMEISVYSLLTIARRSRDILKPGGSILTLTYLGGEKVIPGYNIMGICKSALESSVEYLANELGPSGFRINALSAGPLKTLSSSAVGEFDQMLKLYTSFSPLRRNITAEEVANTGAYLLSDLASGVTGETMHVDAGYHIMGAPPSEMHGKL
jgi:enoyl-[acyl-carrier protein] reductase I